MNEIKQVTDRKNESVSAPAGKAEQTTKPATTPATAPAPAPAPVETKPVDVPLVNLDEALAILGTSKSRTSGGSKIRPNVGYTLIAANMGKLAGTSVPEQEQVIVKILLGALTQNKPVISEPELNKLVVAAHAAGKLKTKQDAWHIFRYYRTDLIKRQVLKQVEIALAS